MLNSAEAMKAKMSWLLKESGLVTAADLQNETGLKTASGVSEWLRTGRIDKRHLPTIARLSGTTERWWLTPEAPIPPTGEWLENPRSTVHDSARAPYAAASPAAEQWPFKFARSRFDRLSRCDKARVEGAALSVLIECERGASDDTKSSQGAA